VAGGANGRSLSWSCQKKSGDGKKSGDVMKNADAKRIGDGKKNAGGRRNDDDASVDHLPNPSGSTRVAGG
jgi:hypothetical protein